MRRPPASHLGLALLVLGIPGASSASAHERQLLLRNRRLPTGVTGLAPEMRGDLPRYGLSLELQGVRYYFVDVDQDGELTPGGADGMAREEEPFVVPIPSQLVTRRGQYDLRFAGRWLALREEELGVERELFEALETINRWRIRAARVPLSIDPEASRKAALHVRYLLDNRFQPGSLTRSVHEEDPGNPSYTADGAEAARHGLIGLTGTLEQDAVSWYSSVYHSARLLDPRVTRVGLAREEDVSLLLPVDVPEPLEEIRVHPCDGARRIPLDFAVGGVIPNPVPSTRNGIGLGYPLVVMLPEELQDAELLLLELEDDEGERVEGHLSTPTRPANQVYPRNFGCLFFIPEKRLAPETRYTARLQLRGMDEPLVWSFTTMGPNEQAW